MIFKIIYKLKSKDIKKYKDNISKLRNILCSIDGDCAELIKKDKNDEIISASKGLLRKDACQRFGEADKDLLESLASSLSALNKIQRDPFFKIIKKELDK